MHSGLRPQPEPPHPSRSALSEAPRSAPVSPPHFPLHSHHIPPVPGLPPQTLHRAVLLQSPALLPRCLPKRHNCSPGPQSPAAPVEALADRSRNAFHQCTSPDIPYGTGQDIPPFSRQSPELHFSPPAALPRGRPVFHQKAQPLPVPQTYS